MRLLLVEDSDRLAPLIVGALQRAGYVVDCVSTLAEADAAVAGVAYDLLLLDLGLPGGDGLDWLRERREKALRCPVLVVTARSRLEDRVAGLDTGADDYIVKPFETDELLARCRAVLRRPGTLLGDRLSAGNLSLDTAAREISIAGRWLEAGKREIALLEALIRRIGHVVRRSVLEDTLYSFGEEITPNAIEAQVSRLRRRLAGAGATVAIHTVRGIGYMLREEAAQ